MTRCFVALELANYVRAAIVAEQDALKQTGCFTGNWEKEGNMHITMRFIGELDDAQLNLLQTKLRSVQFSPFDISIGPVGFFTRGGTRNTPKQISVLWTKIEGAGSIQSLIDKALLPEFKPDKRHAQSMASGKYSHHGTLCRVKNTTQSLVDCEKIIKNSSFGTIIQNIDNFVLYKSTLSKNGAVYSIIESYPAQ